MQTGRNTTQRTAPGSCGRHVNTYGGWRNILSKQKLVSPFTMYGYDASYALEVHRQHPGRFALVKPVDATDPGVAETIADWAATPGTVGIRILLNRGVSTDAADPGRQGEACLMVEA